MKKTSNVRTGDKGEDLAVSYLKKMGWAIIDRNKKAGGGEIDIVAREPSGTLVFVEVKTLKSEPPGGLMPEDEFSSAKRQKTERAIQGFVGANPKLVNEKKGWRMDVVAIVLTDTPTVRHYENA